MGRILCLRIEGIEVKEDDKAEDVFEALHEMMIPDNPSAVLDLAHRIGQVRFVDGKKCLSTIVKFVSFRHRTIPYRKRKYTKDLSIRIDLTKTPYNLLKMARQKTNVNGGVEFVYADGNCKLKMHLAVWYFHR